MDTNRRGNESSAHAHVELRWGRVLPSLKASARVPGSQSPQLMRLGLYIVTMIAIVVTIVGGFTLGVPLWLLVLLLVAEIAFGVLMTLRE